VKRMQREFQGIDRQPPSGVIQCRMPFQQGHSS
jgi:hypothetical protein